MCFPVSFAKFFRITFFRTPREAVTLENLFLKISQNLQENICLEVSF